MDIKAFIDGIGQKKEEMFRKAVLCKSINELSVLARENGFNLSEEDCAEIYASLHPKTGVLSDDELDSVTGAGALDGGEPRPDITCPFSFCGVKGQVVYDYKGCKSYLCRACQSFFEDRHLR